MKKKISHWSWQRDFPNQKILEGSLKKMERFSCKKYLCIGIFNRKSNFIKKWIICFKRSIQLHIIEYRIVSFYYLSTKCLFWYVLNDGSFGSNLIKSSLKNNNKTNLSNFFFIKFIFQPLIPKQYSILKRSTELKKII